MTSRWYGIGRGMQPSVANIAVSTATTGLDVEIVGKTTLTKDEVFAKVCELADFMMHESPTQFKS